MDKSEYATRLAGEMRGAGHQFTRSKAERFVGALISAMAEGLSKDRKLIISNFGTFTVNRFGAKIINSPRGDNRQFFMPPTDVIKWHPSMKIRDRAPSSKVSDEIYNKLITGEIVEELPPDQPAEQFVEKAEGKRATGHGKYDINIEVYRSGSATHISDEQSPISKFVRSIINNFIQQGNNKLEIRPEKMHTVLVYYSDNSTDSVRVIPAISHKVIVDRLKLLAGDSMQNNLGLITMSESKAIKISLGLTRFGEAATLEPV